MSAGALVACSSSSEGKLRYPYKDGTPVEWVDPKPLNTPDTPVLVDPVSKVEQRMNIPAAAAWERVIRAVSSRDIPIDIADSYNGVLQTKRIAMQDSMCQVHPGHNAPLRCRTRYFFQVAPLTPDASSVSMTYEEICQNDIRLVCPGSSAERLLLDMAGEIFPTDEEIQALRGEVE